MSEYVGEHISIRDCIVCVEKRPKTKRGQRSLDAGA
jgi:hypothetical protein